MKIMNVKVYVKVNADFNPDGLMLPREWIREDGENTLNQVIDIQQAAVLKAGGQGDQYTIEVRGHKSYLYFERSTNLTRNNIGRWFVERKSA